MERWEYCEVEIHIEGHLLGPKTWLAYTTYYASSGKHRTEKMTTDFTYEPDRPATARDAMGQVLARLGEQGWELVRYQGSLDSQVREALLKRRGSAATA